jgi:hypothetical protein
MNCAESLSVQPTVLSSTSVVPLLGFVPDAFALDIDPFGVDAVLVGRKRQVELTGNATWAFVELTLTGVAAAPFTVARYQRHDFPLAFHPTSSQTGIAVVRDSARGRRAVVIRADNAVFVCDLAASLAECVLDTRTPFLSIQVDSSLVAQASAAAALSAGPPLEQEKGAAAQQLHSAPFAKYRPNEAVSYAEVAAEGHGGPVRLPGLSCSRVLD